MTISIIEIPEGRKTAPTVASNTALVCLTVCTGVGKRLHTLPSHPTIDEPQMRNADIISVLFSPLTVGGTPATDDSAEILF